MLALRPYQQECSSSIKNLYKEGYRRILVVLPTASGKTVIFSKLAMEAKGSVLILVNRTELLHQALDKLQMISPEVKDEVGLLSGDHKQFDKRILIASVQSASQPEALLKLQNRSWSLVIYDEAHHAVTPQSKVLLSALGFGNGTQTKSLLVGFTATAFRTDGVSLGQLFDKVAYELALSQMVEDGWLCPIKGIKIATNIDLSAIEMHGGDFQAVSLAKVMNSPTFNNLAFDVWNQHAYDKEGKRWRPTLAFAVDINHAEALKALFVGKGISAQVIHSNINAQSRKHMLEGFRSGSTTVLCNVMICTEGVDLPETEIILNLRPTRSKTLFTQMVGRALRLSPLKKEALLLDFSDKEHTICNLNELLPDNKERHLAGERKAANALRVLPTGLDQRLKAILLEANPLSNDFAWINEDGAWVMKGNDLLRLKVIPFNRLNDKWLVLLTNREGKGKLIAENLSFSYAFGAAETFAKDPENRKMFLLSDLNAPWRQEPASENQKGILKELGYKTGIDKLTKGDASDIIRNSKLKRSRSNNKSRTI